MANWGGFRMYLEFYGFSERPFTLLPDPNMLFWSKPHSEAFAMMEYGVMTGAPITVITGEIGAGKTTLIRHLLNEIDPSYEVGLMSNIHGSKGELLHWVLMALGQDVPDGMSYVKMHHHFQRFLIDRYAEGRRTVLIIDEAQNLPVDALEELRMFSNINADKNELLQLILVGQPELSAKIARPELMQFAQRISSQFHMPNLSPVEVRDYLQHRLNAVGADDERIFTPSAVKLIHETTGGAPRLINLIADLALVHGFSKDQRKITPTVIRKIVPHLTRYGAFRPLDVDPVPPQERRVMQSVDRSKRTEIKVVSPAASRG